MNDEGSTPERFLRSLKPLQGALEAFCRRGLYDASLTEDVLQEAMMRAFADYGLFTEGTNFRAWIFRYVHLGVLEANRRSARHRHSPIEEEIGVDPPEQMDPDESLVRTLLDSPESVLERCDDDLAAVVQCLRPVDRSILLLKAVGEFKYREIAEILSIPLGTVMSSLARARTQVRRGLAARTDDGPRGPEQFRGDGGAA